jgi:hypothetical protein
MSIVNYGSNIPSNVFPKDYGAGHFVVVGNTGSGKTYYIKYLVSSFKSRMEAAGLVSKIDGEVPIFVFVCSASAHDWVKKEKNGKSLLPKQRVFTDWTPEIIEEVDEHCKSAKRGFMIFDDFKSVINFQSDPQFKNLLRTVRHVDGQLLMVGHYVNDLPPIVRTNIAHAIVAGCDANPQTIRSLADAYYSDNVSRLVSVVKSLSEHTIVKINIKKKTLETHKAPPPSVTGFSSKPTLNLFAENYGNEEEEFYDTPLNTNSTQKHNENAVGNRNVSVDNGANYYDRSDNRNIYVENDITHQKAAAAYRRTEETLNINFNRDNERSEIIHKNNMSNLNMQFEAKNLLLQGSLMGDDLVRASSIISQLLNDNSITPSNLLDGPDKQFMNRYYKNINYTPRSSYNKNISKYGSMGVALVTGNKESFITEGIQTHGSMILKKASNFFGMGKEKKKITKNPKKSLFRHIVYRNPKKPIFLKNSAWKELLVQKLRDYYNDSSRINIENCYMHATAFLFKVKREEYIAECKLILKNKLPKKIVIVSISYLLLEKGARRDQIKTRNYVHLVDVFKQLIG